MINPRQFITMPDYLESVAEVDTARVGVAGCSGGGTQAAYLSAVDDRIGPATIVLHSSCSPLFSLLPPFSPFSISLALYVCVVSFSAVVQLTLRHTYSQLHFI